MTGYMTRTSDKSKKEALRLCKYFGWVGAHRYYVGKIGTGILYSCTFGLAGVGWAMDLVKIANGTFTDNVGAPLRQ